MTINLPPDLERVLVERAKLLGTTPEAVVVETLRATFLPEAASDETSHRGQTLADFLHGYVGVLNSSEHVPGGAGMSVDTGGKFVRGLRKKRDAGRL